MTPQLEMQSLHHFKWWWLFAKDGRPSVLYRRRVPKTDDDWVIEWGDLDSNFFTNDDLRRDFQRAWDEHLTWIKANAP